MEDLINEYTKTEGIMFELRAINGDGEVLIRYEDYSADEVASYADLIDQKILQMAIDWNNERHENIAQAEAEEAMESAL